jgi:hypothetical protein
MKISFRIILFVLLVGGSFIAGGIYDDLTNFWKKPVNVRITNKSGQPIKSVLISFSGYQTEGNIRVEPNESDKSIIVRYYQTGEGSLSIEAELASGKILRSNEGYIESGYSFDKEVTPEGIKSR